MNVETRIKLDKFQPREYQLPLLDALENKHYKRALVIWPRRSGKDIVSYNWLIRQSLKVCGVYYYIFPTYSMGRKILFDSIDNDGFRILNYLPSELIESINSQEMKIRLRGGSIIQVLGSDRYDGLVGTNPKAVVFSEYALQDPRAYSLAVRPILLANDGIALFISTPRGKNHLFELYQIAMDNPDTWFHSKLTVNDTKHVSLSEIQKDIDSGEMSEEVAAQEWFTSFDRGVEGSWYAKYLDKAYLEGRIGEVPYESGSPVYTAWDLGVSKDANCIIFFQVVGQIIRIIDCYTETRKSTEHYVGILKEKGYIYSKHIAPHDVRVFEQTSGLTRWERYRELGVTFTQAPDLGIIDGIDVVRANFNKLWIDAKKCAKLIKSLENYRQEFNVKRNMYEPIPYKDWSNHLCFTGDTPILTRNGMRRIMDIIEGDEVLTLEGWRKCSKAVLTQKNAKLVEVAFSDGTKVKCTPEHLFLTVSGWKSAEHLTRNMRIRSSLMNSISILMEAFIEYGQMRSIFLKAGRSSIAPCGKMLLDQYQKIVTYITETVTPIIITSGISNVYPLANIESLKNLMQKDLVSLLDLKRLNGTDLNLEDCGIKGTLRDLKVGRNGSAEQSYALLVNQSLRPFYDLTAKNKNSATQIVKPLTIARVTKLSEIEDVYDIYVPDIHHFSLYNGAIVHNCDTLRYALISIKKLGVGTTKEELEQRYNQAKYGDQYGMPAFFRDNTQY